MAKSISTNTLSNKDVNNNHHRVVRNISYTVFQDNLLTTFLTVFALAASASCVSKYAKHHIVRPTEGARPNVRKRENKVRGEIVTILLDQKSREEAASLKGDCLMETVRIFVELYTELLS
jgi:hypothetical protein